MYANLIVGTVFGSILLLFIVVCIIEYQGNNINRLEPNQVWKLKPQFKEFDQDDPLDIGEEDVVIIKTSRRDHKVYFRNLRDVLDEKKTDLNYTFVNSFLRKYKLRKKA